MNTKVNNLDLKEYLKVYIDLICNKHGETNADFAISLFNVDAEIFEILKNEPQPLGDIVSVCYLPEEDYSAAVSLRNNPEKDKIVLLTRKSIKHVDSLKHFKEYEIFPALANHLDEKKADQVYFNEILWRLPSISEKYQDAEREKYERFFSVILYSKRPSLCTMLSYILASLNRHGLFMDEWLNRNLKILDCWPVTEKELLTPTELKKTIRNSDSGIVLKRLDKAKDTKVKTAVFENDFHWLIENLTYEEVKEYFSKKPRSKKKEKEREADHIEQWIYDYDVDGDCDPSEYTFPEGSQEETLKEDIPERLHELYKRYACFIQDFERSLLNEKSLNNLCVLIEGFRNELSENFLEALHEFCGAYDVFYPKVDELFREWPALFPLKRYVEIGYPFAEAYLKLLRTIYSDEQVLHQLNSFGVMDYIYSLFMVWEKGQGQMPFYHPIAIMYLCMFAPVYAQFNERVKNVGEVQHVLLEEMMDSIKDKFLVNHFYTGTSGNKILYQIDMHRSNLPYSVHFTAIDQGTSIRYVEPTLVFQQIYQYIERYPYVTLLKIMVIGELGLSAIHSFERTIKHYIALEDNILEHVELTLSQENAVQMRNYLDQGEEEEFAGAQIAYRFISMDQGTWNNIDFAKAMQGFHLVIMLNSRLMYSRPYIEIPNNKDIDLAIRRETLDQLILRYRNSRMNCINFLWSGLQYSAENPSIKLGNWIFGKIDINLWNKLSGTISNERGLEIILFSSNPDIGRPSAADSCNILQALDNQGETIYCARLANSDEIPKVYLGGFKDPYCIIPIKQELIERMQEISEPAEMEQLAHLSDFSIAFVLDKAKIKAFLLCPDVLQGHEEFAEEIDLIQDIAYGLARYLFGEEEDIFQNEAKKVYIALAYSYCRDYGDVFLCNYLFNTYRWMDSSEILIMYVCKEHFPRFDYLQAEKLIDFVMPRDFYSEGALQDFRQRFKSETILVALQGAQKVESLIGLYLQKINQLKEGLDQ